MNDAIERIALKAAELAGADAQKARVVAQSAAEEALARCRREDIPEAMEAVIANIAADILSCADISSMTQGDISVTFREASPWEAHAAALYSFRRLA